MQQPTSITIPASVTSIGNEVFDSCTGLTQRHDSARLDQVRGACVRRVLRPDGHQRGYLNAKYSSLDGVLFNKNLTKLILCPGAKSGNISIPSGVTSIGDCAFSGCKSLTGVTIPSGVTNIGCSAFSGCKSLIDVIIPRGVTSIGDGAFFGCVEMTSVTIPSGVTSIGNKAFCGCGALTCITMPSSVRKIGDKAFSYCNDLTSATIPARVTSIGEYAFYGCTGLVSIFILDSLTSFGLEAFNECPALKAITVSPHNAKFSSKDGVLFNKKQTKLILCPSGVVGVFAVPEGVTSIGACAFYHCKDLTCVTIPASVNRIEGLVFSDCTSLVGINVDSQNNNYSSLGGVLFNKKQTTLIQYPQGKAGNFTIPASVTSIEYPAFNGCTGLTNVTIPASVNSIADFAFGFCRSLTSLSFLGDSPSMGPNVFDVGTGVFTVYYLKGKTGFTSPMWNGYKAEEREVPP